MTYSIVNEIKSFDTNTVTASALIQKVNELKKRNDKKLIKGTGVSKATLMEMIAKEAIALENKMFDDNRNDFGLEIQDYESMDVGLDFLDLCILVRIDLMEKRANEVREMLLEEYTTNNEVVIGTCTQCSKLFNEKTEKWVNFDGETWCEKCQAKNDSKLEEEEEDNETKIITAVEIATEIGINPKTLRRKLRKLADQLPKSIDSKRWVFKIEVKAEIIEKVQSK